MKKIAVIFHNKGPEATASILSAKFVCQALKQLRYQYKKIPFSKDINFRLLQKFDLAFNVAHGKYGEDGFISALLNSLKIPNISPSYLNCHLTYNKDATKQFLEMSGLPVAKNTTSLPLIAKPSTGGSSNKIEFVKTKKRLAYYQNPTKDYILEEYLPGREFCATAYNSKGKIIVLPIIEIKKNSAIYTYQDRYISKKTSLETSPIISKKLNNQIRNLCLKCFTLLDCDQYIKIDIILDKTNQPHIIEVDGIPGFGNKHLIFYSTKAANIPYTKFISDLIQSARIRN